MQKDEINSLILELPDPFGRSVRVRVKFEWIVESGKRRLYIQTVHSPFMIKVPFLPIGSFVPTSGILSLRKGLTEALNNWGSWKPTKGLRVKLIALSMGLSNMSLLSSAKWHDSNRYLIKYKVWGATNSMTKKQLVLLGTSTTSLFEWHFGGLYLRKEDIEAILNYIRNQ